MRFIIFTLAILAMNATAQIPPIDMFTAEMAAPAHIVVTPAGTGQALTSAYHQDGSGQLDATITVTLTDWNGDPIFGYPGEDIWLNCVTAGLFFYCSAGTIADTDSDANGQLFFYSPLLAGGQVMPGDDINVMVAGDTSPSLTVPLSINSPDVNGDLVVNLSDIVPFTQGLQGPYDWRIDFNVDGTVNLSDVVVMAQSVGLDCPSFVR